MPKGVEFGVWGAHKRYLKYQVIPFRYAECMSETVHGDAGNAETLLSQITQSSYSSTLLAPATQQAATTPTHHHRILTLDPKALRPQTCVSLMLQALDPKALKPVSRMLPLPAPAGFPATTLLHHPVCLCVCVRARPIPCEQACSHTCMLARMHAFPQSCIQGYKQGGIHTT